MKKKTRVSNAWVILITVLAAISLLLPTLAIGMDGGKININLATQEQLTSLPGIGMAKAEAIVAYRKGQGPFTDVDGLLDVKGIGTKLVEKLRDLVTTE